MGTQTTFINPVARNNSGAGLGTGSGKIDFGWSGVVVPAAGSGIIFVSGQWTVPNFTSSMSGASNCVIWVGIDGKFGSDDVLQAGIGCDFNGGAPDIYAWWEWYPDSLKKRRDMPVSVGDVINCSITGQISSDTATIEFRNLRPGAVPNSISIPVQAKQGQVLKGTCAEWVVEALLIKGNPTTLCGYGKVQFSGCTATDANGSTLDPYDSPGATVFKLQQNGQIVSYGSCPASGQVICSQDPAMGRSIVAPNAIAARALPAPNTLAQRAI